MTMAKRPTATITNEELEQVSGLTYRDAAIALGVGGMDTVRQLYKTRGVYRPPRRPGEMVAGKTRAAYKTNGNGRKEKTKTDDNGVLGLYGDGRRVKIFWEQMTEYNAKLLGLGRACPDLGTEICLACELEIALPDCDFKCGKCEYEQQCPCSLFSWLARQDKDG